ncbi:site-2 protease family protein [Granulicella tundricola]|uniref:Peptidase M50 n=1 Tax=Granulicella tundricola (strain ATCC BAA-1859 / DSM 23138 / MP5ACTX9) TaxID=1198114 RepID=E8WZT3_GRATM|nr:site-2 protease family protein [Granulicella tundricola]ADW67744.1 peptidase M50 [Granulicella tundricola MP5ACTX9]
MNVAESVAVSPVPLSAPEPIFNCPECSHWLAPGTLACPDCHAIVYAQHMKAIATAALAEEGEKHWAEAREIWRQGLGWLPAETKQYDAVVERMTLLDGRIRGAEDTKAKWTKRLGPLAPVVFFLAKAKSFLFILFKLKFLLSFVGFFAIYWALFGWRFGLGFTLSILVHEMGHYVAARRRGLKVDLPVFLPGLGAYVRWYSMGINLEELSSIALAGPFFGLIFAVACGAVAKFSVGTTQELFSALAHVTAWLNLLNLIPVFGLDGAQATYALDKMQRWLILASALIFFGLSQEWMLLGVAAGMGWRLWTGDVPEKPGTGTFLRYVLLIFALGIVVYVFPDTTRRF